MSVSPASGGIFDLASKQARLKAIEDQAAQADFWSDPETAREVLKERGTLRRALDTWQSAHATLEDTQALLELAEEEDDAETLAEVNTDTARVAVTVRAIEFAGMMSGEADANACYVQINSGEGGTDAKDWASMLLRMYSRWAERHGMGTEVVDLVHGEEAGLSTATLHMQGEYAYGYMKAEIGVHRLVRISPFDAGGRRQTSFASVFVTPEMDDDIVVDLKEEDVRVDTYRASGAGGQHVNKTDSAVRLTHLPSGVAVQCQNERSQHKNRSTAWKMLRARLYDLALRERQAEAEAMHAAKSTIGFGSQIRSYVLQPYRLVKDLRTQVEMGDVDSVLDGNLDPFIEAFLLSQAGG